jgi:hypothetical protein
MQLMRWATRATFVSALLATSLVGCTDDPSAEAAAGADGKGDGANTIEDSKVEAARAELDALYKGDYRRAFVEKDPALFLRHIHDDFSSTQIDGSTGNADVLRQFFPLIIDRIERVVDHNVTIEDLQLKQGRIEAIVTLSTVMDRRSPTNVIYNETSVGTYRDVFVQGPDGELLEISGDQLRVSVTGAPRP